MEENSLDQGIYLGEPEDLFEDGLPEETMLIPGEPDYDDEEEIRRQDIGLDLYLEACEEACMESYD